MSLHAAAWEVVGGTALLAAFTVTTLNIMTASSEYPISGVDLTVNEGSITLGEPFKDRATFLPARDDCSSAQIFRYLADKDTGVFIPLEPAEPYRFSTWDGFEGIEADVNAPDTFEGDEAFLAYDFCYLCERELMCRTFYSEIIKIRQPAQ